MAMRTNRLWALAVLTTITAAAATTHAAAVACAGTSAAAGSTEGPLPKNGGASPEEPDHENPELRLHVLGNGCPDPTPQAITGTRDAAVISVSTMTSTGVVTTTG